jgi:hypothetical protein
MNAPCALVTAALVAVTVAVPRSRVSSTSPALFTRRHPGIGVQPGGWWPYRSTVLGSGHLAEPAERTEPRPQLRRALTPPAFG